VNDSTATATATGATDPTCASSTESSTADATATRPLPQTLADLNSCLGQASPDQAGALWRLTEQGRQLDSNLVRLPPEARVAPHVEPDLDVLLLVVAGGGTLETDDGARTLAPSTLIWLPRGSSRALTAGDEGLAYLTVHRARPGMTIRSRPGSEPKPAQ
jgi:quercetin dioxygenase-like cupin family protein